MGQMAQSTGDYFVLLGRYEEARGEYQSALTTYEQVLFDSADFGEAQSNKQTVLKSLGDLQDKLEEEFLIGQMAQATGEYFALLRRYDEARGEYLAAIDSYEKITPSFPNFLQAQTNKDNISVLLESLQLESSVNQRQVEEDEDISGVTKAIDNSTDHNNSKKESLKSIRINFYAFHLLKDPITQQEIPKAMQKIVDQWADISRALKIPNFLEDSLGYGRKKNNGHLVKNHICWFNRATDGINIDCNISSIIFTDTCILELTIDFSDVDYLTDKYFTTCLRVADFLRERMQISETSLGQKLIITIIDDDFTTDQNHLAHIISSKLQSDIAERGKIFNQPFFEIDSSFNDRDTIWLWFLDKEILRFTESIDFEMLNLLYYRIKLIWLYNRFQSHKDTALEIYQKLKVEGELSIEKISEESYFYFTTILVSLESYYYKMIIANKNHNSWLKKLQLCATENENNDFIFLDRFDEEFHNYSEENQGILNYLKSAQYGFHQMLITINSIDNKKEIEKQKIREKNRRDRNLQILTFVTTSSVSAGVTAGGVAAFRLSQTNKQNTGILSLPVSPNPYSSMVTGIFNILIFLSTMVLIIFFIRLFWSRSSDTK